MPIIESLLIDPAKIQLGEMQPETVKPLVPILIPVTRGRNGRNYFRFGSAEIILGCSPLFLPLTEENYTYLLEIKHRLPDRFLLISEEQMENFTVGVDAFVKDGKLRYNHRELAVWATFEQSKHKISFPII